MDWVKHQIIVVGTTIGAFMSWVVGGIGMAFTVLLGMMVLDYITGLMVGYVNKELSSSVGIKGLVKKTYTIILISAVYLMQQLGFDLAGYTADGLAIVYALFELLSIVENGGKLGAPIPDPLKNAIAALKSKGGDPLGS